MSRCDAITQKGVQCTRAATTMVGEYEVCALHTKLPPTARPDISDRVSLYTRVKEHMVNGQEIGSIHINYADFQSTELSFRRSAQLLRKECGFVCEDGKYGVTVRFPRNNNLVAIKRRVESHERRYTRWVSVGSPRWIRNADAVDAVDAVDADDVTPLETVASAIHWLIYPVGLFAIATILLASWISPSPSSPPF
jgi:hypothetical protein